MSKQVSNDSNTAATQASRFYNLHVEFNAGTSIIRIQKLINNAFRDHRVGFTPPTVRFNRHTDRYEAFFRANINMHCDFVMMEETIVVEASGLGHPFAGQAAPYKDDMHVEVRREDEDQQRAKEWEEIKRRNSVI